MIHRVQAEAACKVLWHPSQGPMGVRTRSLLQLALWLRAVPTSTAPALEGGLPGQRQLGAQCQPRDINPFMPVFHILGNFSQGDGLQPDQINDVSSVFRYRGVWHVFHQFGQHGWAHVVSRDGAHWQRLRNPLVPDVNCSLRNTCYDGRTSADGSLTVREGVNSGQPVIIYDIAPSPPPLRAAKRQQQHPQDLPLLAVARPANPADPLLEYTLRSVELRGVDCRAAGQARLMPLCVLEQVLVEGSEQPGRVREWQRSESLVVARASVLISEGRCACSGRLLPQRHLEERGPFQLCGQRPAVLDHGRLLPHVEQTGRGKFSGWRAGWAVVRGSPLREQRWWAAAVAAAAHTPDQHEPLHRGHRGQQVPAWRVLPFQRELGCGDKRIVHRLLTAVQLGCIAAV